MKLIKAKTPTSKGPTMAIGGVSSFQKRWVKIWGP